MTPKKKAEELFKKMYGVRSVAASDTTKYFAKQNALIAVEEILVNFGTRTGGQEFYTEYRAVEYWEQVKTEIEKL